MSTTPHWQASLCPHCSLRTAPPVRTANRRQNPSRGPPRRAPAWQGKTNSPQGETRMGSAVQTYAGSSGASEERMRLGARKVVAARRSGLDVVVVVSAMGNTTSELLDL